MRTASILQAKIISHETGDVMDNLPSSSSTHDQERRSRLRFQMLIPDGLFLYREENGGDYGVDMILELKTAGKSMSNFRSHAQLKSVQNPQRNTDGTFSFPVPIKTLNYLLNQIASVFVVYLENEDKFLWAWATDVASYCHEHDIDPVTTEQGTVAYRFVDALDGAAFERIHARCLGLGDVARRVTEIVTSAVPGEPFNLSIDTASQTVLSPDEAAELIKRYGIWLVNNGRTKDVLRWLSVLTVQRMSAEVNLVGAYALFHVGQYYDAMAFCKRGTRFDLLPEPLHDLGHYMLLTLRHLTGSLSNVDYETEVLNFQTKQPLSLISLQLKLQRQRELLLRADRTQQAEYATLERELTDTIEILRNASADNPEFQARLDLTQWELEGVQLLNATLKGIFDVQSRDKIGHPFDKSIRIEMARELVARQRVWMDKLKAMEQRGWTSVVTEATANLIRLNMQIQWVAAMRVLKQVKSQESDESLLRGFLAELQKLVVVFEQEGYLNEMYRSRLLIAQCTHGLGNETGGTEMTTAIRLEAEAAGITDVVAFADHLLNAPVFDIEKQAALQSTDEHLIELDESTLSKYVRQVAEVLEIRDERIENVHLALEWLRLDAFERRDYCQNLHVIENLSHTSRIDTVYSINPLRVYTCAVFGYTSQMPSVDRGELLASFKARHCLGCSKRSPKGHL